MKYVSKQLKTTKVMSMLAYPTFTRKAYSPTNILGIVFVMDQNQMTCAVVNKTHIQLVEMKRKTIGPQKLQSFIAKRTKRIPTSKSTTRYLSRRI